MQSYNKNRFFQWLHQIIGSENIIFFITHSISIIKMLAFLQANRMFFLKNRKWRFHLPPHPLITSSPLLPMSLSPNAIRVFPERSRSDWFERHIVSIVVHSFLPLARRCPVSRVLILYPPTSHLITKKSSPSPQGTKRGEGRIIDVLTSSSPLAALIGHRRGTYMQMFPKWSLI